MPTILPSGTSTLMFRRLWTRAPRTSMAAGARDGVRADAWAFAECAGNDLWLSDDDGIWCLFTVTSKTFTAVSKIGGSILARHRDCSE